MKLLFTEENFSELFKELLGFVNKDLAFNNYKADLFTASNELVNIIGNNIYKLAIDNEDETDEDKDTYHLVWKIRYAISINAYRLFAPNGDLSHTGDGRKMRNEEHESNAFEWMIEKDNKALEKRYYRALDDLITFLDNSKIETETTQSIYTVWISSDEYKSSQQLFIRTVSQFNQSFVINSRYLLMTLQPGMKECEDLQILSRIGKDKFNQLKDKFKNNTEISEENDILLLHHIRNAVANYALAWAIPRLSINVFPEGIVQGYTSDRQTMKASKNPLYKEAEWAKQSFQDGCKLSLNEIENIMAKINNQIDTTDTNVKPAIDFGDKFFSA
jgi:hypothetical protein